MSYGNKMYSLDEDRKGDTTVVIRVTGRIDSSNAWDFDRALQERLRDSDKVLVLECKGLRYISSAGLRVTLMLAKRFKAPKRFALSGLSNDIVEIMRISGFDQIVAVFPTESEALAG